MNKLRVFISFSGDHSMYVATQLKMLISEACASADPWLANEDIRLGGIWNMQLMNRLESSHFGVFCLDQTNLKSEWMHFEAGSIAKRLGDSAVFPYLSGIGIDKLSGPFANFQSTRADKDGTFKLLSALNKILYEKELAYHTDDVLRELFDALWPKFESRLEQASKLPLDAGSERSDSDMLNELLRFAKLHSRLIDKIMRVNHANSYPPIHDVETSDNWELSRLQFETIRESAMQSRKEGNYVTAIALFKQALNLEPNDMETMIDIAVTETFLDAKNYSSSIEKLNKIVIQHKSEGIGGDSIIAKAYYNLACIKEIARNETAASHTTEEIFIDLEEAMRRYPPYVETAEKDIDFRLLREQMKFSELINKYNAK